MKTRAAVAFEKGESLTVTEVEPERRCVLKLAMPSRGQRSSESGALLFRANPLQELPRRNRADAADDSAKIARNVRVEEPVPE
jgi:hypothetical protein